MATLTQNPLETLIGNLEARNKRKTDYIVPAGKLIWTPENDFIVQHAADHESFYAPSELFESQIAEKLGIPMHYFRKMKQNVPQLLTDNVNQWLGHYDKNKYLVRGFTNDSTNVLTGRAFLSNSYNIIDDYEVLFAALEAIKDTGVNVKIDRAEVTENRLYLHVTCPEVEINAEAFLKEYLKENDAAGNGIISGFTITNSEVGRGAFEIRPRAVICKCNNGLIVKDERFRRVHLGSKLAEGEVIWSDKTQQKNKELIISQVTDAVKTYLSADHLGVMVQKLADLHDIKLEYPVDAVQNVCKTLSIDEKHKTEILQYFLGDGMKSAAGLYNAITRETQNMDADTQFEIEGNALELMFKHKSYDKPFSKN